MYSQHGQKQKAAEYYLKAAQTLDMEITSQIQVAIQKEPNELVELSLENLLQALRSQIATVKPEYSAFGTPAKSFLQEAMQTYCKCRGLQISDCNEPKSLDSRFSDRINLALMEFRELYAQLKGDVIDLQGCLQTYISAEGEAWLAGQMRILLILCYAYIEGKAAHFFWDYWAELQSKLIDIYTKVRDSLSDKVEEREKKQYRKCCERLFRVEHLQNESCYLIAENKINSPIIKLLKQWHEKHKAEVITNETPLESETPLWRASKTHSQKAMQLVLGKHLQKILHSGAQLAKIENVIKMPCRKYADLGVCNRGDFCRSFHSSTRESITAYLMRLARQTRFAHFQVKLALEMRTYCTNEGDISQIRSAMSISRHWLERLQESMHIISAFSTNSSVVSQVYQSSEVSKEGLADLASRVWLNREYSDYNVTSLLQTFYMIVQMGGNYIPIYCKRFIRPFQIDWYPLPVWLTPSNKGHFAWSVHANLFNIIKHARDGNARKLVWAGSSYVNFLVTDGTQMGCGNPWILIWILEVVVAVSIAAKRKFHGITLPATVIFTFFSKQKTLCRDIIHSNHVLPFSLCNLCQLAMRVWHQKVCPLQTEEDWFAGCLRIQTILVACSYHVGSTELNQLWSWMQEVNKEMLNASIHATYLPVVNSESLDEFCQNMVSVLNETHEPLTAIRIQGQNEVPWSAKNTKIVFTVNDCGSIWQVQNKLQPDGLHEENIIQVDNRSEEVREQKKVIDHEATTEQEIAAACIIQSWVRKMQAAKQQLLSRDGDWDKKFEHACLKSKTWTSARYRMWYLGLVMAKLYDIYKLHQSLESNKLRIRRNMAEADAVSLDKFIDQEEKLREVKEEAEKHVAALHVENERHAEADRQFLKRGYREAVKTLRKARRLHFID